MAALTPGNDAGPFAFETEEMAGTLEGTGYYHGVRSLAHKAVEQNIVRSDLFLLSFYRALVTGKQLGHLRELAAVAEQREDALAIVFPPCDWHPAEVRAVYQIVEPDSVDLHITVRAQAALPRYQLYISSYFDWRYEPYVYVYRGTRYEAGRRPRFVRVAENDLTRGYYVLFPRDLPAAMLRYDGRWRCGWDGPEVNVTGPYFAEPLAFMFDQATSTACAIMGRKDDCDTLLTTYAIEEVADPISAHNAIYFTLFGTDLAPGDEWTTTLRLTVVKIRHGFDQVLKRYEEFTA